MNVKTDFFQRSSDDGSIWRRFKRNASLSATGSALSIAIKFAQTALLTRVLSLEDFGRLLIVLNLFVFLESFFGVRVSDALFRFFPAFQERDDKHALKGLLLLGLGLSLASGLTSYGLVFFLSPVLAEPFYPNLGLAPLFRIYGCTILLTSFSGVYEPILRLHDRFRSVIVPQVIGSMVTLVLLGVYLVKQPHYDLQVIAAVFAIGVLIQTVPPLVKALSLSRGVFAGARTSDSWRGLQRHRAAITSSLFNSNLSGYLKLAISPGDIFLLGLFSTPTQIAWYGLAKQLTAPLAFLQTNIQTAVIPEITALTGHRHFRELRELLTRYLWRASILSGVLLSVLILFGHLLIVMFLPPDYGPALPVFYLLAVAAWLLLVLLVFRPLALSLDQLPWHNLALLISSIAVIAVVAMGRLSALSMAIIQLADALVLRSLFSAVVWRKLKERENLD